MSTPATIPRDDAATSERRGCPRDPLDCVVLVFFDEKNWGRVIDIHENGMRIEFARPPKLLQRMNFTTQAMAGATPIGEEIVGMPFQVYGEIVWLQEFERNAGVRFEALKGRRAQFRRWLSFATSSGTPALGEKDIHEKCGPRLLAKPFDDLAPSSEAPPQASIDAPETHLEVTKATIEPHQQLNSQSVLGSIDAPRIQAFSEIFVTESLEQEQPSNAKSRMTRKQLVGATFGLAVIAAVGGVKMSAPLWAHKPQSAEQISGYSANQGEPVKAGSASASESSAPFLVEVSDDSNHRWLLRFTDETPEKEPKQIAGKSGMASVTTTSVASAPRQKPTRESAKNRTSHEFKPIAPIVRRLPANGSSVNAAAAAPAIPGELAVPSLAPIGNVLAKGVLHAPPPPPLNNEVQKAHLISAVPAAYPPLAESNHIEGDVTVDAFVDSTGRVTDVNVISGNALLAEAAVNAVRQWRYEPARLRGQPAGSHISVTMKFRFDQSAH